MSYLKRILTPKSSFSFIRNRIANYRLRLKPNLKGTAIFPPGHYHSPLLDIESLGSSKPNMPFDGTECWEQIDLRPQEQRDYYEDLLDRFPLLPFPRQKTNGYRYFTDNEWFVLSDAFAISGIIRKEKPRKIVEIGSGFSSGVMLDTLSQAHESAALTFIEPFPDRLHSLLSPSDRTSSIILAQPVQEVSLPVFDQFGCTRYFVHSLLARSQDWKRCYHHFFADSPSAETGRPCPFP